MEGGRWDQLVFSCAGFFGDSWEHFFRCGPSSQKLFAINREKRWLDQEGFPGLGVDGSCKVELNFCSEKRHYSLQCTVLYNYIQSSTFISTAILITCNLCISTTLFFKRKTGTYFDHSSFTSTVGYLVKKAKLTYLIVSYDKKSVSPTHAYIFTSYPKKKKKTLCNGNSRKIEPGLHGCVVVSDLPLVRSQRV